jgi:hypothetical protein
MRSKTWFRPFGFAALALAACTAPPVEAPATTVTQSTPIRVPQSPQNKVDVLFMVDNSSSMAAMQNELQNKFSDFFTVFTNLASAGTFADLHIGVVTSDYGAGDQDNTASGCGRSPGGDLGHLIKVGKAAAAGCVGPTDNYITYAFQAGGTATSNLVGGSTTADLVSTFTCMASGVSSDSSIAGCGFEHQLESVYAALHNTDGFNNGFLRSDALLTVVFLTNEDDGSASPTAHIYEDSATAGGPSSSGTYGVYNTYRQTHWAVECNNAQAPYSAMANLMNCEGSPNAMNNGGLAYDISRYVNYFTASSVNGGVKADPNDVILVAIDAPTTPFSTILGMVGTGGGANPTYTICPSLVPGTCDVHLQHSCQNMVQPGFFGDPPIRLNTVVNKAKYHQIANICGNDLTMTPDYTQALSDLGMLISSNIGQGCIPQKVLDATNPDCAVNEVTPVAGAANQLTAIPACNANGGAKPCWMAEMKPQCAATAAGGSPQGIGITVEYASADGGVPTGSYLDVQCNTIAAQSN